jgi:FtsZ-binding cell division protein ZapB
MESSIKSFKDTINYLNIEVTNLKKQNSNLQLELHSLKNKVTNLELPLKTHSSVLQIS